MSRFRLVLKPAGVVSFAAIGLMLLTPLTLGAQAQIETHDRQPFDLNLVTANDIDIYQVIESLGTKKPDYLTLHDWSSDGKFVLFSYGLNLALVDQEGNNAKLLDFSIQKINPTYNPDDYEDDRLLLARFSPTDSNIVYLLTTVRPDLFRLNQTDGSLSSVTDAANVFWFDVMPDPNKLVVAATFNTISKTTGKEEEEHGLWLYDLAEKSPAKLLYFNISAVLDLSYDGTKLLARGKSTAFEIFDLKTNKTQALSIRDYSTERSVLVENARWTPNDRFVVFSAGFKPNYPAPFLPVIVAVQSADEQNSYELIRPVGDEVFVTRSMILSPNGETLLVFGTGYGQADAFRLDLAQAVPEFSPIALLVAAATMTSVISLIRRTSVRK